jgi:GT2 family glycosyltransferase
MEHLEECFDTLLLSTYPNARYLLVDNASDDGSVEFVRTRYGDVPGVEILECGANLGWSGGNNLGMEHALAADADYVLLLNNDTRIAPDALDFLVRQAEADLAVGALSPKILMYDNPEILNSVGLEATIIGSSWDKGIGRADAPRWDVEKEIIGVCGAAMFIRGSALQKTGLLPTDFDIYLDDLDLCLRIWMAGYTIRTCPKAQVWHKFSATMGTGERARHKYYLNTCNRVRIILRNYPVSQFIPIGLLYFKGECKALGRAVLDGEWWRIAAHIKSWLAAIAYIPKTLPTRLRHQGDPARFWPMILRAPLFFPGTVFPAKGFYPPEKIRTEEFQPISPRTSYSHAGGPLCIKTCSPEGVAFRPEMTVRFGDSKIAHLTTETPFLRDDVPPGEVTIESAHILSAEESGRRYDIGGWIRITTEQSEPC